MTLRMERLKLSAISLLCETKSILMVGLFTMTHERYIWFTVVDLP